MPTPRKNEKKDKFISRCMSDSEAKKSFPDQDQRVAFCFSEWKRSKKKKSRAQQLVDFLLRRK